MLPANLTSRIYCIGLGPRGNPRCQVKVPLGSPGAAETAKAWLAKYGNDLDGGGPLRVTVEKGSIVANRFIEVWRLANQLKWPKAVTTPIYDLSMTEQPPGELRAAGILDRRRELVARVKVAVRAYAALVRRRVS